MSRGECVKWSERDRREQAESESERRAADWYRYIGV